MSIAQLHKHAETIFIAGVKAVDPGVAVRRYLKLEGSTLIVGKKAYDLRSFRSIIVIGAGKASAAMAQPIEKILGDRIKTGTVNVKYGHSFPLQKIQVIEAGHPIPDESGYEGAQKIIQLLRQTTENDLVICLVSGGGSALLPCPVESLALEDKKITTQCLLESGATIQEINVIRKHVSQLKGGRLARIAYPSVLIALILSDVIGDDLESIASGLTVPDQSTYQDCMNIIRKYNIRGKIPTSVIDYIESGARGKIEETPKSNDPTFQNIQNIIIGNNRVAVHAAKRKAEKLGYNTFVLSDFIDGEAREAAKAHASIAKSIIEKNHPVPRPACVISGGETTVTIRGKGLGGRNQEFALASAIEIKELNDAVILSGGTDGTDGPTDAAGAFADGTTLNRAETLGLDANSFLAENDSYNFFQKLGDLLVTGPTFTNVMDLQLIMVGD